MFLDVQSHFCPNKLIGTIGAHYRWLFFATGPMEAAVSNRALGFEAPEGKERMLGYGSFDAMMDTLEKAVAGEGYICRG